MEMKSDNINELAKSLAVAQGEFPVLEKKSKAYNYMYADLAETLQAIQKPLAKNGLSIVHQMTGEVLVTKLIHESGQWIETQMPLVSKSDGKTNPMQALGSAITYAKRYSIGCLLNLAADKEIDDDGAKSYPSNGNAHHSSQINAKGTPLAEAKPNVATLSAQMIQQLNPYFAEDLDAVEMVSQKFGCHWTKLPVDKFVTVLERMKERKKQREEEEIDLPMGEK